MDATPEFRLWTRCIRVLAVILALMLPLPTLAQSASASPPPDPRWLLSPRLPANAIAVQTQARPPGFVAPSDETAQAVDARRPTLTFATVGREEQQPVYFSFKDPCVHENLNSNDEPLSQRTNCEGLGIPSGWFDQRPRVVNPHPR